MSNLKKHRKRIRAHNVLMNYKAQVGCCICGTHLPEHLVVVYNDDAERKNKNVRDYMCSGQIGAMLAEVKTQCSVICYYCKQKLHYEVKASMA